MLVLAGCAGQSKVKRVTAVPDTRIHTMDRAETGLADAIAGKPALVSLWATWCEPCRDEVPALKQLDVWTKEHGGLVVAVAVGEPIEQVTRFANEKRLPYLLLVDEEFRLADALGQKRVPTTLLVDASGRIVRVSGALDDRATAAFKQLVEGPPAAVK